MARNWTLIDPTIASRHGIEQIGRSQADCGTHWTHKSNGIAAHLQFSHSSFSPLVSDAENTLETQESCEDATARNTHADDESLQGTGCFIACCPGESGITVENRWIDGVFHPFPRLFWNGPCKWKVPK